VKGRGERFSSKERSRLIVYEVRSPETKRFKSETEFKSSRRRRERERRNLSSFLTVKSN